MRSILLEVTIPFVRFQQGYIIPNNIVVNVRGDHCGEDKRTNNPVAANHAPRTYLLFMGRPFYQ